MKNHFVSLVLAALIFNPLNLAAQQKFTSLSKCREHFQTNIQAGSQDIVAMDVWCKKQMNELDFCAESALLKAMTSSSFSAAQIPQLRQSFENRCKDQIAAQATNSNNVAGNPSNPTGAAFDANGVPLLPKKPTPANCAALAADQQSACTTANAEQNRKYQEQLRIYQSNLQAYNQRQEQLRQQQAAQQQARQQQQQQNSLQAMQTIMNTGIQIAQNYNRNVTSTTAQVPLHQEYRFNMPTNSGAGEQIPTIKPASVTPSPEQIQIANSVNRTPISPLETEKILAEMGGAREELITDLPASQTAANEVASQPIDASSIEVPESNLSISAQARNSKAKAYKEELYREILYTMNGEISLPYRNTNKLNTDLGPILSSYFEIKTLCVNEAKRTNKLCIEGNSPGAKAVKGLIDFSGPVLATISSAQKACSSTKKVLNLAQLGLTVAKGLCVASKLSCDSKCFKSETTLNKLGEGMEGFKLAVEADDKAASADCKIRAIEKFNELNKSPPLTTGPAKIASEALAKGCIADVNRKSLAVIKVINFLMAWLNEEKTPIDGTTKNMIASCKAKGKDLALMTANILTLSISKNSAAKCEKELSTAGSGGGGVPPNVTTTEYCADPARKDSEFCKCQSNPTADGCVGGIVRGGGPSGDGTSSGQQRGVGLNAQGGPNGFAGSGSGGSRPSGSSSSSASARQNNGSGAGAFAGGGSVSVDANGSRDTASVNPVGSGAPNMPNAGVNSTNAAAAEAAPTAARDDKKWSFGAFSGSSSSFGSGHGSGGANLDNGDAQISEQQQEAIERKLASDRYAAEVTTSTGPNNFDKIKQTVRQIGGTLDPNQ